MSRWERIEATRSRDTGRIRLVDARGDWQWLSQFDGVDWGSVSNAHSRRHTAQLLLAALGLPAALNPALCCWLVEQPYGGWSVSAGQITRLFVEALVAAGV